MRLKKTIRFIAFALAVLLLLPVSMNAAAENASGVVRVLLTKLKLTDQLVISLDGSYTLDSIAFQRGSKLTVVCSGGTLYVYYEGMSLAPGKQMTLIRHAADDGLENGLRFNGGYELHPGDLHLSIVNGSLRAVLHAPVEEYLLGVVPYEMSDSFPLEALKAQAVAARTYALKRTGANRDYDVEDNTNDQAYYGIKAEHKNAARAVRETAGLCGYSNGGMADCYYSASNGGQTELASHVWGRENPSYLIMTDDPYDLQNPESAVKRATLPKQLRSNEDLGALKNPILDSLSELLESRGYDGDMSQIQVVGIEGMETALPMYRDAPSQIMTLLRLFLNVRARRLITEIPDEEDISIFTVIDDGAPPPSASPAPTNVDGETWSQPETLPEPVLVTLDIFPLVEQAMNLSINPGSNELITVRETNASFVLESRRFGHGVGMSQRGAQWMAGVYRWTYDQILRFYYPGMKLQTVNYTFSMPAKLDARFLTTPGPAATPTPRPTVMPVLNTPGPQEYKVKVTNMGVNSYLNLRAQPNTQSDVLRQLYYGQELIVTSEEGEWLTVRTDDLNGYVMKEYVQKVE
ncbi:MAG: SpoIID/LytB domain-containing protein [Clostridia bacterium]|nr:SpoIID/LytB domain-containing protein [Clostridia bacterium]